VTGWLGRRALRTIHEFRTRLARYHLQHARAAKLALTADPVVETAVLRHAQEHSLTQAEVRRQVEQYVDEIVPQLNVLSYYKIGYNLAKIVLNLLYRVTVDHQDEAALERIPKRDVVVYAMNHRSNVDYVVVAYVLAYGAHVSYAVGEWARVWPLEYVFKARRNSGCSTISAAPHSTRRSIVTSGSCRSPSTSTECSKIAHSSANWWTSATGPDAWRSSGPWRPTWAATRCGSSPGA